MDRVFVLEQDGLAGLAFFCGNDGSRGSMDLLDAKVWRGNEWCTKGVRYPSRPRPFKIRDFN